MTKELIDEKAVERALRAYITHNSNAATTDDSTRDAMRAALIAAMPEPQEVDAQKVRETLEFIQESHGTSNHDHSCVGCKAASMLKEALKATKAPAKGGGE